MPPDASVRTGGGRVEYVINPVGVTIARFGKTAGVGTEVADFR